MWVSSRRRKKIADRKEGDEGGTEVFVLNPQECDLGVKVEEEEDW